MLYSQAMIFMRSCRLGICRWVLPLHNHPQLYIACYLVVKVSTLIWQVDTKRSSKKISLILLYKWSYSCNIHPCMSRLNQSVLLTLHLYKKAWLVGYYWACVDKFCVLELRVWWLSAVAAPDLCCFQGVAICRNLVLKFYHVKVSHV